MDTFCFQGLNHRQVNGRVAAVGAHGQGQGIDDNIFCFDAVLRCCFDNFFRNGQTSFCCIRDAVFIQAQTYHGRTVLLRQREHVVHGFLFAVDRVQQRFTVVQAQGFLHGFIMGSVNFQRRRRDGLQSSHGVA